MENTEKNNIVFENENYRVQAQGGPIDIEGNHFEHTYELYNRVHDQLEFRTPSLPEILSVARMWNDSLEHMNSEEDAADLPPWTEGPSGLAN